MHISTCNVAVTVKYLGAALCGIYLSILIKTSALWLPHRVWHWPTLLYDLRHNGQQYADINGEGHVLALSPEAPSKQLAVNAMVMCSSKPQGQFLHQMSIVCLEATGSIRKELMRSINGSLCRTAIWVDPTGFNFSGNILTGQI